MTIPPSLLPQGLCIYCLLILKHTACRYPRGYSLISFELQPNLFRGASLPTLQKAALLSHPNPIFFLYVYFILYVYVYFIMFLPARDNISIIDFLRVRIFAYLLESPAPDSASGLQWVLSTCRWSERKLAGWPGLGSQAGLGTARARPFPWELHFPGLLARGFRPGSEGKEEAHAVQRPSSLLSACCLLLSLAGLCPHPCPFLQSLLLVEISPGCQGLDTTVTHLPPPSPGV